jgi:hypothetical protein
MVLIAHQTPSHVSGSSSMAAKAAPPPSAGREGEDGGVAEPDERERAARHLHQPQQAQQA